MTFREKVIFGQVCNIAEASSEFERGRIVQGILSDEAELKKILETLRDLIKDGGSAEQLNALLELTGNEDLEFWWERT